MHAVDRTVSIGERASELMRAYSRCASPRSYELWYTYVTGLKPQMNEAVKRIVSAQSKISSDDVDSVYAAYLADDRLAGQTDRTGSGLLVEMQQVLGLIEAAVGTTERYSESLESLQGDLAQPLEKSRMRDIVETLVTATREVSESNKALETRLKDSRREIEGLRHMLEEVRVEGLTDPLTGIANRKHFEATLASSVATAHGERLPVSLIVIDIDEFKRFNDLYGHLTGDQVLRLVGAAMRENVEGSCTLARFGGEEFGIIMPGQEVDAALRSAEKIRRNVMGRELLKRSTKESLGRVTISLGVAGLRPDDNPTSFLERADLCMYRAKRTGRNRTVTDCDPEEGSGAAAAAA